MLWRNFHRGLVPQKRLVKSSRLSNPLVISVSSHLGAVPLEKKADTVKWRHLQTSTSVQVRIYKSLYSFLMLCRSTFSPVKMRVISQHTSMPHINILSIYSKVTYWHTTTTTPCTVKVCKCQTDICFIRSTPRCYIYEVWIQTNANSSTIWER